MRREGKVHGRRTNKTKLSGSCRSGKTRCRFCRSHPVEKSMKKAKRMHKFLSHADACFYNPDWLFPQFYHRHNPNPNLITSAFDFDGSCFDDHDDACLESYGVHETSLQIYLQHDEGDLGSYGVYETSLQRHLQHGDDDLGSHGVHETSLQIHPQHGEDDLGSLGVHETCVQIHPQHDEDDSWDFCSIHSNEDDWFVVSC